MIGTALILEIENNTRFACFCPTQQPQAIPSIFCVPRNLNFNAATAAIDFFRPRSSDLSVEDDFFNKSQRNRKNGLWLLTRKYI